MLCFIVNAIVGLNPRFCKLERHYILFCAEKISAPEEKSVCLVRTTAGLLTHVGIYAGDGFIIHSRNKTGAVCERMNSPFLTGRIECWYHVNTGKMST